MECTDLIPFPTAFDHGGTVMDLSTLGASILTSAYEVKFSNNKFFTTMILFSYSMDLLSFHRISVETNRRMSPDSKECSINVLSIFYSLNAYKNIPNVFYLDILPRQC